MSRPSSMLSIGTVSAGNSAQREYHERQLAESRDDYYRESEGPPGTWVGAQAEAMGLTGEVELEQFRRMLDGQNPATGDELGGRMDRRKTVAFDLAFSAPKSVSLMRMAADEPTSKAIDRAHDKAVRAALAYIEDEGWKGRARVQNEAGEKERKTVDGTGVIGVLYRHETTRNADPQLHSHAVLANIVRPGKGDVQAINSPVLYQQAKTAGSVYQAVLRGELGRELGLQFDQPVNGLADIKGFARELIERFSTRRAEILQRLAEVGFSAGGSAAEKVALESRRAKDMGLDHGVWRTEVRETLQREGFGVEQVQALVRTPAERELVVAGGGPDEGPQLRTIAERLADAPLNQVFDARPTEDARAIVQAGMSVPEGFTAAEVAVARKDVLKDDRLVVVQVGEKARYTGTDHLALEERVQAHTLGRMHEESGPKVAADGYEVPTRTPDGHPLSTQQREVLSEILTSGRGVDVIRARAGSGKTTIAGLAKTEFEAHGIKVVGVAPTLQALAELDDVGLENRETIALTAFSVGEFSKIMRTMDHQTVVLVDECSMAQTRSIAPLLDRAAERGAKVVAIGDDIQLSAVGAGGWFRYLAEHKDAPHLSLTEVHRQRDPVERERLNGMHRGDVDGWIRWADQHDRIAVQPTVQDAYVDAVDRYTDALEQTDGQIDELVVMAPENAHRHALNERLRRVVVDRGIVDRTHERNYGGLLVAPGDRLVGMKTITIEGTSRRPVENGERFEVLTVGRDGVRALAVAGKRRGDVVKLPADVLEPTGDGRIVDHAYARTIHKAQGMTTDRSILFSPDPQRLGLELAYVGVTRTRDRADLITVGDSRPNALGKLARGMAERHGHQTAMALMDPDKLNPERLSKMSDPEIDEHRHTLLTEAREAMTRLTRLDREARGAWAGSGDARTDAQLLAQRDQLAARVDERQALLDAHDPGGVLQARGLMEDTSRQALDRDRGALERLDARLEGRELVDVDELDGVQQQIRKARVPVQGYLDSLLKRLDDVHGQQIDRSTTAVDPLSVPEHERPSLALRQEATRSSRINGLTLSAAQQLGTGHPTIAKWLDAHAPAVQRTPDPEREPAAPQLTGPQQRFVDAMLQWREVHAPWARVGGRRELDALTGLAGRLDEAIRERDTDVERLADHDTAEPAKLRRATHADWETRRVPLAQRVDVDERQVAGLQRDVDAVEERHGMPIHNVIDNAQAALDQVSTASTVARRHEQDLLRLGPVGLGEQRTLRQLGPRDGLNNRDQQRYDQLAGRTAVRIAMNSERPTDPAERWPSAAAQGVGTDIARWRDAHDLPLNDRQQQTIEQDREQTQDRDIDRGPDLSY